MRNQQTFATHAAAVAFLNTIPTIVSTDQRYIIPETTTTSTRDDIIKVRQENLAYELNALWDVSCWSLEVMREEDACVWAVFCRTTQTTEYTLYYYTP